jgi:hypothetical protein
VNINCHGKETISSLEKQKEEEERRQTLSWLPFTRPRTNVMPMEG